MPKYPSVLD